MSSSSVRRTCSLVFALGQLLSFAVPTPAVAEPLPISTEIIARARIDRFNFEDALEEVRRNVPAMDVARLESFLLVLDELDGVRIELGFSEFDYNPVSASAYVLTRAYSKTMDVSKTRRETLVAFGKWADDETRDLAQRRQLAVVRNASSARVLRPVFDGALVVRDAIPTAMNTFAEGSGGAWDKLAGQALARMVAIDVLSITENEVRTRLAALQYSSSFGEVLRAIEMKAVQTKDAAVLRHFLKLLRGAKSSYEHLLYVEGFSEEQKISQLGAEILSKMIGMGAPLHPDDVKTGLGLVDDEAVPALAGRVLATRLTDFDTASCSVYRSLVSRLSERMMGLGYFSEATHLQDRGSRIGLVCLMEKANFEGLYSARLSTGQQVKLTVARAARDGLVVSYIPPGAEGAFSVSLSFVQVLPDSNEITLSSRPVESEQGVEDGRVWRGTFSFQPSSGIRGVLDTLQGAVSFSATRLVAFENLWAKGSGEDLPDPTGSYRGLAGDQPFILRINGQGRGNWAGTLALQIGSGQRAFPLSWLSWNPKTGALVATVRDTGRGTFLQLRGRVFGSAFSGNYIIGDKGFVQSFSARRE